MLNLLIIGRKIDPMTIFVRHIETFLAIISRKCLGLQISQFIKTILSLPEYARVTAIEVSMAERRIIAQVDRRKSRPLQCWAGTRESANPHPIPNKRRTTDRAHNIGACREDGNGLKKNRPHQRTQNQQGTRSVTIGHQ